MSRIGLLLIIIGSLIIFLIYGPVIKEEIAFRADKISGIRYSLDVNRDLPEPGLKLIRPVDTAFGVIIPKINVNEKIFPDIDPTDPLVYLEVLKSGVAQAKGSTYPDDEENGNIFLFAHSTDAFYNVGKYNASFFLLGKLEEGDEVDIFYNDVRYKYQVTTKGVVSPEKVADFVSSNIGGKTVTLQTCYPPGTTLQRLIVVAKIPEPQ